MLYVFPTMKPREGEKSEKAINKGFLISRYYKIDDIDDQFFKILNTDDKMMSKRKYKDLFGNGSCFLIKHYVF